LGPSRLRKNFNKKLYFRVLLAAPRDRVQS